jgi:hypothetical protein
MFPVLDSYPAFATLSFVSSSADAKPLLSDDITTRRGKLLVRFVEFFQIDNFY